jgi:hypothetical protein
MFDKLYTMLLYHFYPALSLCFSKIDVTIIAGFYSPIRKLASTIFHYFIFYTLVHCQAKKQLFNTDCYLRQMVKV